MSDFWSADFWEAGFWENDFWEGFGQHRIAANASFKGDLTVDARFLESTPEGLLELMGEIGFFALYDGDLLELSAEPSDVFAVSAVFPLETFTIEAKFK